ncbi:MAG: hypothetical protein ACI4CY_07900 [Candidatus Gastranaerophilaceae bacterium]
MCNIPEKAIEKPKKECPEDTQASFGLRRVAGRERVFTILSEISNITRLK